jgi:uncharacterized protein with NRDE domain
MCLLLIANKAHPLYKLVIAANRDEFYDRPASPADFWNDYPELLGGKDLEAGGTWLGITRNGRLSAITNFRDFHSPIKKNAPSRGKLTIDFLLGKDSLQSYTEKLKKSSTDYNGFNLVYGIKNDLFYYSNQTKVETRLTEGIYGISNALLDTPWAKIKRSKKRFSEILNRDDNIIENIFVLLNDKETAPDEELPDTGLDKEREKALSSIFIKTPKYGTRCTTVLLIDNDDNVSFIETTYHPVEDNFSGVKFEFTINI